MGQTSLDPVEYARTIVHNCLASEFCELHNTGSTSDFPTTVHAFERYRDDFQVGRPIHRRSSLLDEAPSTAYERWSPRKVVVVAMILAMLAVAIASLLYVV